LTCCITYKKRETALHWLYIFKYHI